MAASNPLRKTLVRTVDLTAPSPRLANGSQSQGQRGAELPGRQQLIGDGLTDWMTEKVDFSTYVSTAESSPRSSLPPSPWEQDVQVPSDLEVMTSLLQEELAQLEDYFRSESTPTKFEKSAKCDKGPQAMGAQSYCQLPYASYNSNQSETSPLLVTLATGELDLMSFCGGPIGRLKMPRPAPYGYQRSHNNNLNISRRIDNDGVKLAEELEEETWSSKGNYSGCPDVSVNHCSLDKTVGRSFSSAKKVRECEVLLKEEENYSFTEDVYCSEQMARGYCFAGSQDAHLKKEAQLMHGVKVGGIHEGMVELLNCEKDGGVSRSVLKEPGAAEEYFHQNIVHTEPCHSFMSSIDEPPRGEGLASQTSHYLFPECLGDQSFECLSRGGGEGPPLGFPIHRPGQRFKEVPYTFKADLATVPLETHHGERKQKKRNQNKTAAHRYRQRKRAELDTLEEELQGLEGQNRELRDKAESVEREIQYVKDLLIEVYKARSQRLKQDTSA